MAGHNSRPNRIKVGQIFSPPSVYIDNNPFLFPHHIVSLGPNPLNALNLAYQWFEAELKDVIVDIDNLKSQVQGSESRLASCCEKLNGLEKGLEYFEKKMEQQEIKFNGQTEQLRAEGEKLRAEGETRNRLLGDLSRQIAEQGRQVAQQSWPIYDQGRHMRVDAEKRSQFMTMQIDTLKVQLEKLRAERG
ncbi:hypothetical protein Q3G72_005880 [Acer saccharum]|nr:hypothetical protein Q3G72_029128 [Acer saccharum]KAK1591322.1 hypothetical protein Q3G72_005880 [Acer saccharum]